MIIALALMLFLGINTIFYYIYFDVSEVKAKTDAFYALLHSEKEKKLEVIKIPLRQLDPNGGDEIWYNGKLYDISSRKISGNVVYLSVLHDENEEQLVSENYNHFQQDPGNSYNNASQHLSKKHTSLNQWKFFDRRRPLYFPSPSSLRFILPVSECSYCCYQQVLTPPPEQMLS